MLEASSFDFRGRHPQQLTIKLLKYYGLMSTSAVSKTAFQVSLDLYRTFAPIKQTTAAMAFASLELAGRLHDEHIEAVETGADYQKWNIGRAEVMGKYSAARTAVFPNTKITIETLLDLLELYTHYQKLTVAGPDFSVDAFLNVRIPLNDELNEKNLPRYTTYIDRRLQTSSNGTAKTNGVDAKPKHQVSPQNGTPSDRDGNTVNGNGVKPRVGERGRDGTIRFMLNPDREQEEKKVVDEYD
jgi:CTD kinase subunit beta